MPDEPPQSVHKESPDVSYLKPYVFRVVILNRHIVLCDNGREVFQYRKPHSRHYRPVSLDTFEFIRRFLEHVLPLGFWQVPHYRFLSPSGKHMLRTRSLADQETDRVDGEFSLAARLTPRQSV